MKVSLTWLKELVEIPCSVDEIAESLSMSGFEVEGLDDLKKSVEGIVVGFVKDVGPHPNADKLSICNVDVGNKDHLQIICGAKNIRKDIHVLVAVEGTFLKSIDLKIKPSELRGVLSQGMICSLGEIGIPSASDGIAILEDLVVDMPAPGSSPASALGLNDTILELAITANRPDGMSMVGIAREISAIKQTTLKLPKISLQDEYEIFEPQETSAEIVPTDGNFALHLINNLDGSIQSPKWMKDRLANHDIKTINAIVDITNYVMIEQGHPLHAYDADLIEDLLNRKATVNDFGYRKAYKGEKMLGIDGKEYVLNNKSSVITCDGNIIAIAGVLGSNNCSVNKDTKRIWLEAALFKPESIRNTSRQIGLRTEASSRYEKGLSKEITLTSAQRAIDLMIDIFNCSVTHRWINKEQDIMSKPITLRKDRINKILGKIIDESRRQIISKENKKEHISNQLANNRYLSDSEIYKSLTRLGCLLEQTDIGWKVIVPAIRNSDLIREIDLIEEIARIIGYDKFCSNLPSPIQPGVLSHRQQVERNIRRFFISSGFQEITTMSLVPEDKINRNRIAIRNPLLSETSFLRTNLWEEHLSICKRNIDSGQNGCWIFEIGRIYLQNDTIYSEKKLLSGALIGNRKFGKWHKDYKSEHIDFYNARGYLESVFRSIKLDVSDKKLRDDPLFHPGKSSNLIVEGRIIGRFGQLHPEKSDFYKIDNNLFLFDLDLDMLLDACSRKNKITTKFETFPTVPSIDRDISFIIDKNINTLDIINIVRKAGKPLIENVELIDRYEGKEIASDKLSLTFRLIYRKKSHTLTETEIHPIHNKIITKLQNSLEIELRS